MQVEEIRDSEDDNSNTSSSSEDNNKLSPLAAIIRSSLPARQLRYFTLIELC
jgi:hypothetical protein